MVHSYTSVTIVTQIKKKITQLKKVTGLSSSSSTKEAASESQSENYILIPSGENYDISSRGSLGGVFAEPTAITKIFNREAIIDVVASTPNMDHGKLVNIVAVGNNWELEVSKNNVQYKVKVSHYQGTIGVIEVSTEGDHRIQYGFAIPESLYAPYRQAEKEANEKFFKRLEESQSKGKELTEAEAVKLANDNIDVSDGEVFSLDYKKENKYILRTPIKKGENGVPDSAVYATVEAVDNNNVHIIGQVWTSKMGTHSPYFDKIVSR